MADEKLTGRCMKCKDNKEMNVEEEVTLKNGGRMAKGTCCDCGGKMCKILPKKKPTEE